MENNKLKSDCIKYHQYLIENFEVILSYQHMILSTSPNFRDKNKQLSILVEFFRQKIHNKNELDFNINIYNQVYDSSISHYLDTCNKELNIIFNYIENNYQIKPIRL